MKHSKYICILLFIVTNYSYSQKITKENFESNYINLLDNLDKENWKASDKICADLLLFAETIDEMETEKKVLRYIKIYAVAGLLNDKVLTKEEALEKIKYLKGKEMIMPAHPFLQKQYVNCTNLVEDEKDTFFSGVNNKRGTQIFSFEYVSIKNGIKETSEELEGKLIVLKGKLNEIAVEGSMLPRFKLKFIEGDYEIQME